MGYKIITINEKSLKTIHYFKTLDEYKLFEKNIKINNPRTFIIKVENIKDEK